MYQQSEMLRFIRFIYPLFFLAIPFPVCGYLSGKSFRKDYAIVYAVFVGNDLRTLCQDPLKIVWCTAVQVLVRVVVLVFSSNAIGVFLSILSMLLEIWIFRYEDISCIRRAVNRVSTDLFCGMFDF
jgi:hypothetical protein